MQQIKQFARLKQKEKRESITSILLFITVFIYLMLYINIMSLMGVIK